MKVLREVQEYLGDGKKTGLGPEQPALGGKLGCMTSSHPSQTCVGFCKAAAVPSTFHPCKLCYEIWKGKV